MTQRDTRLLVVGDETMGKILAEYIRRKSNIDIETTWVTTSRAALLELERGPSYHGLVLHGPCFDDPEDLAVDLCRTVRARWQLPTLIYETPFEDQDVRRAYWLENGAVEVIFSPAMVSEILTAITRMLRAQRA